MLKLIDILTLVGLVAFLGFSAAGLLGGHETSSSFADIQRIEVNPLAHHHDAERI